MEEPEKGRGLGYVPMKVRREVQGVIFRKGDSGKEVLLVKKLGLKSHHYLWRLLKGGVETGETERQALEREIFEEVGLRNVRVLGKIREYSFIFGGTQHYVSTFSVEADPDENVEFRTAEVVDCAWTKKQQALEMLHWKDEKQAIRLLEK